MRTKQTVPMGVALSLCPMEDKGVVEGSLSKRLSRKREAFYKERESDELPSSSGSIKKRRGNRNEKVDFWPNDQQLHSQESVSSLVRPQPFTHFSKGLGTKLVCKRVCHILNLIW